MKAIQDIRHYISTHADSESAKVLARIPAALSREDKLCLSDLYQLDWESFELAIELLRDWRIDRYYADQTDLFDPRPDLFEPRADKPLRATAGEARPIEDFEPAG